LRLFVEGAAVFNLPETLDELLQFDGATLAVATREGKHREFKRDLIASDFSEYSKTLAAFSNSDGGVIVFGVSEKPRMIVGVNQIADEAHWANRLREDFDPEIVIATKIYAVATMQLLAIGVDSSPNRPVICRKSRSKSVTDKEGRAKDVEVLREGAIYFRYAGQTRTIGYTELAAMLAERERRRIQAVMQTLKVMERVGLENTGIVNIKEQTSNLYVSRETAKGLTLIDQGKFVEKNGAPAYVVLGQVNLNRVVHAPLDEADKNLPTEAAAQLKPIVEEIYGKGSTISAQQVSALLKKLINNDNVHCVQEKKFHRKYVTRAGIKAVGDFIREEPLDAIRTFGSRVAIQRYEQHLAESHK
jgi:Putative DNA-binding domain